MTDQTFPAIQLSFPIAFNRDAQPGQTCLIMTRVTYRTRVNMIVAVREFEIQDVAISGRSWDLGNRDEHGCIPLLQPCVVTPAQDIVVTLVYRGTGKKAAGGAACVMFGIVAFPDKYTERLLLGPKGSSFWQGVDL